jgi:hypothetical protein
MKKLIGFILFLISLPVVAQDEKWIIESIPYFSVPATGDMDSDNYMILPKDYYQSEEFLGLLERAYEISGPYFQRLLSDPNTPKNEEAKSLLDKVLKHALGHRTFHDVKPFEDGTFRITIYDKASETEKHGVLDEYGNTIVPCKYAALIDLGNRVYGVMLKKGDDSFWGAVNRRGEVVIPIKYDVLVGDFWSHKYGHVILCDTKGKVGMMNFDGTVAIPFNYDGFGDEWDHVIVARLARKSYILIDKSGRRLTPLTYERIWGDDELHIVGLRNNKEYRLSIEGKETGLQK